MSSITGMATVGSATVDTSISLAAGSPLPKHSLIPMDSKLVHAFSMSVVEAEVRGGEAAL